MKDLLILLVLLVAQLHKVWPLPYRPVPDGDCGDPHRFLSSSNLCCSKCQPGHHLVKECTETTETVCEQCKPEQVMEQWNYAMNCLSCVKCKAKKGLEYAKNCTATSQSRCICKSDHFCEMGYDAPYCREECQRYKNCRVGFGVATKRTGNSNAQCKVCDPGTYSDTVSSTDTCRPHTDCGGRVVLRKGNTTADTVCGPAVLTTMAGILSSRTMLTPASTVTTTHPATSVQAVATSTQSIDSPVSNISTKHPARTTGSDFHTAATICGVIAVLFLIIIILLCLCKSIYKKDTQRPPEKVDANGNESCDKQLTKDYMETKLISVGLEQQCLLDKGEGSSEYSQYSNNTESLPRTDGSSSQESIGPSQPTVALNNNQSLLLSEPMPLISNTNTDCSSILTPSSPQPTSPQIINPVTTSPHVNVNITFHIGNGTCGTQPVMPPDVKQADCKLQFGEEEESFSIPQQEDGKQSLMSVQESTHY